MFGAIEAGGTKMVVAAGDENGNILRTKSIATTTPDETIPKILDFFIPMPGKSFHWRIDCYKCHTCGAEWESDPYPIDLRNY